MKLDINTFQGEIHIEHCYNCVILRYIFYWKQTNICLLRAFCFSIKTIVVASQLKGEILKSSEQIAIAIQKLGINHKHLIWITHVRLSDDCKLTEEKFYKSSLICNSETLLSWSTKYYQLNNEEEISLHAVEDLIEFELEPVDTWFGLALNLHDQKELRKQEEIDKLLWLYLQPNFKLFISRFEEITSQYKQRPKLTDPIRGALFYYPKIKLENDEKYTCFISQQDLEVITRTYENAALSYINRYNPETEVVICVCLDEEQTICGIFPKSLPSSATNNI
jgi:hypothetical protein